MIVSSCDNRSTQNINDISSISAKKLHLKYFEELIIPNNEEMIGAAHKITYHNDGYLIMKNNTGSNLISIIDIKEKKHHQIVGKGRSRNELLGIRDIIIMDDCIWLYSVMDGKVMKLSLCKENREFEIDKVISFPQKQYLRVMPYKDDKFIALTSQKDDSRFLVIDSIGNTISKFGEYPILKNKIENPSNSFIQSEITISPNFKNIAVACMTLDYIDTYNENLDKKSSFCGSIGYDVTFETSAANGIVQRRQVPFYFMFENIVSNNDGFFVGYIGKEVTRDNIGNSNINKIIVVQ